MTVARYLVAAQREGAVQGLQLITQRAVVAVVEREGGILAVDGCLYFAQ
jgi:hypothetical protein